MIISLLAGCQPVSVRLGDHWWPLIPSLFKGSRVASRPVSARPRFGVREIASDQHLGVGVSRSIRLGAFCFGAAVLVTLIVRSRPAVLVHTIGRALWVTIPVVLLWGIVYACNARAWQLLIPDRPARFTFWRAYRLTVSAFAINYSTPLLAVGGEPLKVAGATPFIGRNRAIGSAIGFRFLHSLAHIIGVLAALIPAAILMPHTPAILGGLVLAAVVLGSLAFFLLSQHRAGIFERGLALIGRVGVLGWLAVRLEKQRTVLQELDREMTAIHRGGTAPFLWALATELAGHALSTLEYAFIFYAFGFGFDVIRGFVVVSLASILSNVFFFIPFELGAKEASAFIAFQWLGLNPVLGASAALLSRVRELAWLAIGLGCLLFASGGQKGTMGDTAH